MSEGTVGVVKKESTYDKKEVSQGVSIDELKAREGVSKDELKARESP